MQSASKKRRAARAFGAGGIGVLFEGMTDLSRSEREGADIASSGWRKYKHYIGKVVCTYSRTHYGFELREEKRWDLG